MPITNASPENILRYLHAAGTGTKEAMKVQLHHAVYWNGLSIFLPVVE
ncbi:effector protein PipB [Salmonella enterica subsp. enterica serovar Paratyphi B var. L(+) tartrate +]|nr:effector protein PipB [Salmonella enterica subsp. enterica serovar Java]